MIQKKDLPPEITRLLSRIGEHIRIARKRRSITMAEMAARMYVTRKTLSRLENGDPGVSLSVFFLALWVLDLEKDLLTIAEPENDKVGVFLERQRLPKRVRRSRETGITDDELDF